jgi:predicted AlkP superfamily phosphohydrolase/phosphomutase
MKHFILGIDGGDLEILKSFELPFINNLINDSRILPITEDLLTRGWAEILTGEKAYINNSFYIKPNTKKEPKPTLSYKYSDMKEFSENKLIWEIPQEKGLKVGIMNIPTTYPAPKVDGFFVSGAGGGLYKVDGIPTEMCDSEITRKALESNSYEVEIRFITSGIKDPEIFFNALNNMMEKRVNAFIDLCKSQKTQFGFLALRASANLQYVVMREIQAYMDGTLKNEYWKSLLENHYKLLDRLVEKIFTTLEPSEFIITSDHGQVPLKNHINFNVLLKDLGYLKYSKSFKYELKYLLKSIRNYFGNLILKKNYSPPSSPSIDFTRTRVFGFWYSNGLYINDYDRFKGPVKSEGYEELVNEVCDTINSYPECVLNNIKATPLRASQRDAKFQENIPDIWIDAPDTFFFRNVGKEFIQKNKWYKPMKKRDLKTAPTSMFTGIKGKKPLCLISPGLEQFVTVEDALDLSVVYNITKRHIESL